jgi:hypothetical protein
MMNWYKKAQQLHGEWWIIDGNAEYADQDIGDVGHAAMARSYALHEISDYYFSLLGDHRLDLEAIGLDSDGFPLGQGGGHGMEEDDMVAESFRHVMDNSFEHDSKLSDSIESALIAKFGQDCIDAALHDKTGSAVRWGLQKGWIRMTRNYLEIWELNQKTFDNMVEGIVDAYGESLKDETTFSLDIVPKSLFYAGVPFSILEDRNFLALRAFLQR